MLVPVDGPAAPTQGPAASHAQREQNFAPFLTTKKYPMLLMSLCLILTGASDRE